MASCQAAHALLQAEPSPDGGALGWKAPHTPRQVGGNANNGRNPLSSNLFYFLELISAQSSPRELITSSIRILCGNHQGDFCMYRMKHCKTQRERDLLVIEALLRKLGPLSQVEIHDLTHFQRSAISGLVRHLLKQERLVEAGRSNNSRGRKQVLLRLNEEHGFVLGIGFDDEDVLGPRNGRESRRRQSRGREDPRRRRDGG